MSGATGRGRRRRRRRAPGRRRPRAAAGRAARAAARPGGMMGMGMGLPPAKPKDFRGSFRRLFGHAAARSAPLIVVVVLLAIVSVTFAVIGPKILGDAIEHDLRGRAQQAAARPGVDPGAGRSPALRAAGPEPARRPARRACT